MATRRQPLIPLWMAPGSAAALLLCGVALLAFGALWASAPAGDWRGLLHDSYLRHVVRFSFTQALLSALLSLLPAIPLARALYRRRFPGRQLLLRLCAMTLVLPVWPWLRRQLLPTGALIFMLCFASFATVLSLGGGPQATTIELAIFQALSYDYDPGRAALLALIQLAFCLTLVLLSQRFSKAIPAGSAQLRGWRDPHDSRRARIGDGLLIALALLLLLPPLLAVIVDGLRGVSGGALAQPALWQATLTSLRIALGAGALCVTLTMMLLWSSRELRLRQRLLPAQVMETSGMLILAMPGIVLATGFFLLFNATVGLPDSPDGLVIFANALLAIPYALKVLENPMRDSAERYSHLCASLGIAGWNRLRLIELRALKRPLAQALAFACVLSVGDFGVVALFGSADFRTLPFYLYQQTGAYRGADGAVTALLLLAICLLLFTLMEKLPGRHADTD